VCPSARGLLEYVPEGDVPSPRRMRPASSRFRSLLPIALALGAALSIRALMGRPAAPQAEVARPHAAPVPSAAQRHPLEPERGSAALAPADDLAAKRDSWVELNNEATDDLARGELELAVSKLERCREAEPENPVFTGNLVESLVRLARLDHEAGRLASAIEHLERAIELGRERADLELLHRILERWRREQELSQNDWTEDSDRFELTYDTDRSDILHHSHEVLEHLELCYEDLVRWFELDPLEGTRVRVVLYDPEDFDRLTGLGDWAAGVFDGVVRVSVRDLVGSSDWRYVLRHELVHAFVQALVGSAPPGWLNEGLAQWLENRPGEM